MKVIKSKKDIFTIPNMLSLFRLVLAVLMLQLFYATGIEDKRVRMTVLVLLSAVTDFLDGKIARKFHMVSELGKILDPVADKVTQGVLIICLLTKYKALEFVLPLFLVKEGYMAIAGARVLEKTNKNEGAMWYGKINTVVFYIVMFLLIFIPDMPKEIANILIVITGSFMVLSFVLYVRKYHFTIKECNMKGENESCSRVF